MLTATMSSIHTVELHVTVISVKCWTCYHRNATILSFYYCCWL